MTRRQAEDFCEFGKTWAGIYCEVHNCKAEDIPLEVAYSVAELLLDNKERERWELTDEQSKEEFEATKRFIALYADEVNREEDLPFDEEDEEADDL